MRLGTPTYGGAGTEAGTNGGVHMFPYISGRHHLYLETVSAGGEGKCPEKELLDDEPLTLGRWLANDACCSRGGTSSWAACDSA